MFPHPQPWSQMLTTLDFCHCRCINFLRHYGLMVEMHKHKHIDTHTHLQVQGILSSGVFPRTTLCPKDKLTSSSCEIIPGHITMSPTTLRGGGELGNVVKVASLSGRVLIGSRVQSICERLVISQWSAFVEMWWPRKSRCVMPSRHLSGLIMIP